MRFLLMQETPDGLRTTGETIEAEPDAIVSILTKIVLERGGRWVAQPDHGLRDLIEAGPPAPELVEAPATPVAEAPDPPIAEPPHETILTTDDHLAV